MKQHAHVLLIEQNAGELLLTREVLPEGDSVIPLPIVADTKQALSFIAGKFPNEVVESPKLRILSYNKQISSNITKLAELENFIEAFWCSIVQHPPACT